ncbi:MAG: DUF357 domain-containing protein [Methanothrix sp.]|nr:DUF357 domain-containing protein [Methanothrix sp.]
MNRETGCPGRNKKEAQKPFSDCSSSGSACISRGCAQGKLEEDLRAETVKWQKKAQDLYVKVSGDGEFLENVSAYIRDCQYFLEKGDLIRAFEAVIWAWAWMEIGLQKGLLRKRE